MTALAGWENFYAIVGSSAGALIGLQFVVITLIADRPIASGQAQAGSAFATPTIVHFGAVRLSAVLSAPWHGIDTAPRAYLYTICLTCELRLACKAPVVNCPALYAFRVV